MIDGGAIYAQIVDREGWLLAAAGDCASIDTAACAEAVIAARRDRALADRGKMRVDAASEERDLRAALGEFGFFKFGMGFVGDNDGGENLYIADTTAPQAALARVNLPSMKLELEGTLQPPVSECELTGRSDGQLFGSCLNPSKGATLAQIDPPTATVVAADQLQTGAPTNAFAFAFWGGKFWIFTGDPNQGSAITAYDPATHTEKIVMTTSHTIVGAGVSTCAPVH